VPALLPNVTCVKNDGIDTYQKMCFGLQVILSCNRKFVANYSELFYVGNGVDAIKAVRQRRVARLGRFFANWAIFFLWAVCLKITEVARNLRLLFTVKTGCGTFWAIFS
jgi:hypothetical protein